MNQPITYRLELPVLSWLAATPQGALAGVEQLVAEAVADMNEQRLRELYAAFNARDIDAVLAAMSDDVDWPNGWEGGRVHGRDAVRSYWSRQWAELDARVEPMTISIRADGRVVHVYELRDGLVARMDIEEQAAAA